MDKMDKMDKMNKIENAFFVGMACGITLTLIALVFVRWVTGL